MKRVYGFALAMALVAAPAFASSNTQSVNIPATVTVGSTQLPAGDYKISWTGAGSNAQVTIAKNGKVLATAPATAVSERHTYNSVTTQTQGSANVLQAIQLADTRLVINKTAPTSGQ
jgi:hypothetical protein